MSANTFAVGRVYRTTSANSARRFIRIDARVDEENYRTTSHNPASLARPIQRSFCSARTLTSYDLVPCTDAEVPDALWTGPARAPAAPPPAAPQVTAASCEAEVVALLETLWMQKAAPASVLEAQSEQLMELAIRLRRIARGTP